LKLNITIQNTKGLHATLAAKLVDLAHKYDAHIELHYEDAIVDAKSILGLMSLAVPSGENIVLVATGPDAEAAVKDLRKLLQ